MTDLVDRDLDGLRRIGERNVEIIRLVTNHCRHARVELSPLMGQGLAEGWLGLPVNGRELRCEHARHPSSAGMQLESVAVGFYRANCEGCPHREPQGFPMLATLVAEMDAEAAVRRAAIEERDRAEAAARLARARERSRLLATQPYASFSIGELLDRIDQEEVDQDAEEQLVALARSAPELFTEPVTGAVMHLLRDRPRARLLVAVRQLVHAGRLDAREAAGTALEILARHPFNEAAHFAVDFPDAIEPVLLRRSIPVFIRLSWHRHDGFIGGQPADPTPLAAAVRRDLPGVLEVMGQWLAGENRWLKSEAAGAAPHVIETEPGAAPVLASQLIDALRSEPVGPMRTLDDESAVGPIRSALGAALRARPQEVRAVISARAFTLAPDHREHLVAAYDQALRLDRGGVDPVLGGIVLEECVARLSGDWGEDASRDAAFVLESITKWHRPLIKGQVRRLLGALLAEAQAERATVASQITDPRPAELKQLEAMGRRVTRDTRLGRLREAIAAAAYEEPDAVTDAVFPLLEEREVPDPGLDRVRRELVQLLGHLGRVPGLLPRVVPFLYTSLLAGDQVTRSYAIDAWAEIADDRHLRLPSDLLELIPSLLQDNYVVVHQSMVLALRHVVVRDDQVDQVLILVVGRALAETSDHQFIDRAIPVIRKLGLRAHARLRQMVAPVCLRLGEHLSVYDLDDFLLLTASEFSARPAFAKLLLKAMASPEIMRHQHGDDGRGLVQLLWQVPPASIRAHIAEVRAAALSQPAHYPAASLIFVEVLQQAGEWVEAERLATEIAARVPTTAEFASRRVAVDAVLRGARLERAIATGDRMAAESEAASMSSAAAAESPEYEVEV